MSQFVCLRMCVYPPLQFLTCCSTNLDTQLRSPQFTSCETPGQVITSLRPSLLICKVRDKNYTYYHEKIK